jgi:hypothetical protein
VLDRALFDAVFTQDIRTLGPAISSAKQTLLANGTEYGEVSETFLLFGDPAMGLKVPLPRRVSGVAAKGTKNGVSLSWQAALDCNGNAVSAYNLYRAASPGGTYVKVNGTPIAGLSFADTGLAGGGAYYYVVTAVDGDGLESGRSQVVSATAESGSSGGGGGTPGGGSSPGGGDTGGGSSPGGGTPGAGSSPGGGDTGGGSSGGGGGCFVDTALDRQILKGPSPKALLVLLGVRGIALLVGYPEGKRRGRSTSRKGSHQGSRTGTSG